MRAAICILVLSVFAGVTLSDRDHGGQEGHGGEGGSGERGGCCNEWFPASSLKANCTAEAVNATVLEGPFTSHPEVFPGTAVNSSVAVCCEKTECHGWFTETCTTTYVLKNGTIQNVFVPSASST